MPDARAEVIDHSDPFVSEDQPVQLARLIAGFVPAAPPAPAS